MKLTLEIRRKLFHMALGIALVLLLYYDIIAAIHIFIILIFGIIVSIIQRRVDLPVISFFIRNFERDKTYPGKGAITFFIGSLLAVKLFPINIALASILILALGDSISAIVAPHCRIRGITNKKLLEGTILGIIVGFLSSLFFLPWYEALVASAAAMVAEAVEIRLEGNILDDNIIVPLVAGTTVIVLRTIF